MLQSKSFVKKTKKGKVLKVVREHYLRDDIWSGSPLDPECDPAAVKLAPDAQHYLAVDTNVVLSQMDLLEHPMVKDVIIMSVVLEEVKHRNQSIYQRLRALCASEERRFFVFANEHHRETFIKAEAGESPNDRNDRAIRVATAWYKQRLPQMQILLLTNDVANRQKAQQQGLTAMSVQAYAKSRLDTPELVDLVAQAAGSNFDDAPTAMQGLEGAEPQQDRGSKGGRPGKRKRLYNDHKTQTEVTAGIKSGNFHQGALRVSRFNPFEGWVSSESVGQDIQISGRIDMNRAIDVDVVAVELLPQARWRGASTHLPTPAESTASNEDADEEDADELEGGHIAQTVPDTPAEALNTGQARPTGKVVGIIRRNWRTHGYCGSLQPPRDGRGGMQTQSVLFCPVERRYPMIRLQTRQAATLMDKRLVCTIDSWPVDSQYPLGHYVRALGQIGDKDTETEVLLIENDINTSPFTPAVHACVPPLPWSVTKANIDDPQREDMRELPICSVDPPGCKDIDDALHLRELPNGNMELGVHIADVTHFLLPDTAMDQEASERATVVVAWLASVIDLAVCVQGDLTHGLAKCKSATTVYLVQRRIDMLPKPLTEDICSLRGGVERLAFSVLWEVTPNVDVVNVRFTRSIIKSRAAMTYQEAQTRIDDERLNDEVTLGLRRMNAVAKVLRKRRAERGALQLASPEVKFEIDRETHDPLDVGMYQVRETNQMVEEMMLLANITVAERILQAYASCALLRRHPEPAPRQFEPLLKAAAAAGFQIEAASSKALAASLDLAVRPTDPYFNKLVRIMATRCMTQAVYFSSGELAPPEYLHYGLAAPLYTHFTSPIRRYSDVMVHRLLAASLGLQPLPDSARDRAGVRAVADNLNVRHRNAQMAGRASVELHTLIFFKGRTMVADARITRVRANGLIVFVPKYGIEGPVYLTSTNKKTTSKPHAGSSQPTSAGQAAGGQVHEEDEFVLDEDKQQVTSKDGRLQFTIFDKAAVRICIEETFGHRRQLQLSLVDRSSLPASELMD